MYFLRSVSTTKSLAILTVLAVLLGTTRGKRNVAVNNDVRSKTETVFLDSIYAGCNNGVGSQKVCFGIFGGNCSTLRTCSQGVTIAENKTHIEIVRFQSLAKGDKSQEHHNYAYAFRLGVNPFEKNGMETVVQPKCKKQLQPSDFILRIFRFTNETLRVQENMEGNVKETVWLRKSDWRKLCKEDILKEYNSRINTFDTRYIVFQNKFYYDIDTESLGSYVVPESSLEDFKDPDLYSTTDGRLFLNFNNQELSQDQGPILDSAESGSRELVGPSIFMIYFLHFVIR